MTLSWPYQGFFWQIFLTIIWIQNITKSLNSPVLFTRYLIISNLSVVASDKQKNIKNDNFCRFLDRYTNTCFYGVYNNSEFKIIILRKDLTLRFKALKSKITDKRITILCVKFRLLLLLLLSMHVVNMYLGQS